MCFELWLIRRGCVLCEDTSVDLPVLALVVLFWVVFKKCGPFPVSVLKDLKGAMCVPTLPEIIIL